LSCEYHQILKPQPHNPTEQQNMNEIIFSFFLALTLLGSVIATIAFPLMIWGAIVYAYDALKKYVINRQIKSLK